MADTISVGGGLFFVTTVIGIDIEIYPVIAWTNSGPWIWFEDEVKEVADCPFDHKIVWNPAVSTKLESLRQIRQMIRDT